MISVGSASCHSTILGDLGHKARVRPGQDVPHYFIIKNMFSFNFYSFYANEALSTSSRLKVM